MKGQFRVYYSSTGVVCLDNHVELDIMDALEESDLTITDMSRILGIPATTSAAVSKRLCERGLLESYKSDDNLKNVYYRVPEVVFEILRPHINPPPTDERGDIINGCNPLMMRHEDITMSLLKLGIDMGPLLSLCGMYMGNHIRRRFEGMDETETMSSVVEYLKSSGYWDVSIDPGHPMSVTVHLGEYIPEAYHTTVCGNLCGFIRMSLENATGEGYQYRLESEGDSVRITFEQRGKPHPRRFIEGVIAEKGDEFAIVSDGRNSKAVLNRTCINIIHEAGVDEHVNVNDLARSIGIAPSTVSTNLSRLADAEIVSRTENGYDMKSSIILERSKEVFPTDDPYIIQLIRDCVDDPSKLPKAMAMAMVYSMHFLRFNLDGLVSALGSVAGKEIVRANEGSDIMTVLGRVSTFDPEIVNIEVVSPVPLILRSRYYNYRGMSVVIAKMFFVGFIEAIVSGMTGLRYRVTECETFEDDEGSSVTVHLRIVAENIELLPPGSDRAYRIRR